MVMELKLVYRALRKVSDWTLGGYYSEVYIEGQENVVQDGPLIIASSHHNEIIDIATLAVTIPYRRHLSFWAKSTLFINPITRAILLSSGAIPVKRNPNKDQTSSPSTSANSSTDAASSQSNLFRESSNALSMGQVIGVFPEGTSYTQPSIIQVMPGAAWAAIEFTKWARERKIDQKKEGSLKIVPVGIVYTDKSRYLSRVYVRYGKPITISDHADELFSDDQDTETTSKLVAKKIMGEVEEQMREMTINAVNWDTLYAAETARSILWEDETRIPLKDWVAISQTLVKIFDTPANVDAQSNAKTCLIKYCALLHYTRIEPSILNDLLPQGASRLRTFHILLQLPATIFKFILFMPPMILYLPAYITGGLAGKCLSVKGEAETRAQFKAVGGGVGLGMNIGFSLWCLRGMGWLDWYWDLLGRDGGILSNAKRISGILGTIYGSVCLLIKWHNFLVTGNYRRFKRLFTFYKLFMGLLHHETTQEELEAFTRPPPPPPNPFIKKRDQTTVKDSKDTRYIKSVSPKKLVKPLLKVRAEAIKALDTHLKDLDYGGNRMLVDFLRVKGAKIHTLNTNNIN